MHFTYLHSRPSLRRLRTAFSSSSSTPTTTHPTATTTSPTSNLSSPTTTTSPSTSPHSPTSLGNRTSSAFSNFSALSLSSHTSGSHPFNSISANFSSPSDQTRTHQHRQTIRRKQSLAEVEQEEERRVVKGGLLGIVEPRPDVGLGMGGIEEVLEGRV